MCIRRICARILLCVLLAGGGVFIAFSAVHAAGECSYEVQCALPLEYKCMLPSEGDARVGTCVLPSQEDVGADEGDIIIEEGETLQMESNTELAYDSGHEVQNDGYLLRARSNTTVQASGYDSHYPTTHSLVESCASNPDVCSPSKDTVLVVYTKPDRSHYPKVAFRRSNDGGSNWQSEEMLREGEGLSRDPDPRITSPDNGNTIFVTYTDYDDESNLEYIKLARSTDGGNTWDTSTIEDSAGFIPSSSPNIAAPSKNVVYVFYEERWRHDYWNYALEIAKSTDGGRTWEKQRIREKNREEVFTHSLEAHSTSRVSGTYGAGDDGDTVIRTTDGGSNWTKHDATRPYDDAGDADAFIIDSYDSSGLFWYDVTASGHDPDEAYLRQSTDGGSSWNPPAGLSGNLVSDDNAYYDGEHEDMVAVNQNVATFTNRNGWLRFGKYRYDSSSGSANVNMSPVHTAGQDLTDDLGGSAVTSPNTDKSYVAFSYDDGSGYEWNCNGAENYDLWLADIDH